MSSLPDALSELTEHWHAGNGIEVTIRPICAEDLEIERLFIHGLSEEAKHFRFMGGLIEASLAMLKRLTAIDYRYEMAFIAVIGLPDTENEIGVARYVIDPDGQGCEFAIVVSDAYRRCGIATRLLSNLMRYAKKAGLKKMRGEVSTSNHAMLGLMQHLGFNCEPDSDDPSLTRVSRSLI